MAKRGYCLNTSTIRNCGLSPIEEIQLAAQIGYDGIELWTAEIFRHLSGGGSLDDLRAALESNGVQAVNLIAFFAWAEPDKIEREAALEEARVVFQMAAALNCRYVAAPPAGVREMSIPAADLAPRYAALQKATEDTGVLPLLEFWGGASTLGTLQDALDVLDALGDPDARMLADVFHMSKSPGSEPLLSRLRGEQLGLFHVNDYPKADDPMSLNDSDRVYPGDGCAPIADIVRRLDEIGYAGMWSLELFNESYEENGAEHAARVGLEKTRRVFS